MMRSERYRTYDYELTLIAETYDEDEIGNQIPIETETFVLCRKESAGRTEFYNAAAKGHRPEFVLAVHKFEYDGQKTVQFEGLRYSVIRTYDNADDETELTCERVAANG
ncbi:MAG: Prophage pi2 protein [Paenibacillus sp.]|jgi:SPP1 family predicted phage head-tail adaptor|nr:Prophage pi2 protein [Paenibacillus sp.]